ncbi:MAG: polyamine aminopropyltransferase [Leptospiraceae bacterium]|nr:polyamine aminopropyltransferase [Leptospiraceae bacterium]
MELWFTENLEIASDMRLQLRIERTLHSEQSPFQKIDVLETTSVGRMLILDDVIMTTEFDEFAYHEMIAHVPAFAHPDPKRALVIGGGDGGTIRELCKHKGLEEIHLCEIDERVVEVCKAHLPSIAAGFDDSRVQCYFEDGAKWAREHQEYYDLILVDSSDPVGPAAVLFGEDFYKDCYESLRNGGILATQAENIYMHAQIIERLLGYGQKFFQKRSYYNTRVPTYPGGMIGFTFFGKGGAAVDPFTNLDERFQQSGLKEDDFRFWNPETHRAAFALPAFASHMKKYFA